MVYAHECFHRDDLYARLQQALSEHPQSGGPMMTARAVVIDEKMFAFKDELSSNSR
jgi:hypothetical protein